MIRISLIDCAYQTPNKVTYRLSFAWSKPTFVIFHQMIYCISLKQIFHYEFLTVYYRQLNK